MEHSDANISGICHYCQRVPLDLGHLTQAQERVELQGKRLKWSLGTLGQMKQRNCKLCRLINFMLFEAVRTRVCTMRPSHTQVHLQWGLGTLGLSCFSLNNGERPIEIYFQRSSRKDSHDDKRLFFIPHRGKSIDFKRIRAWMDRCADKHIEHCKEFARTAHYGKPVKDSYPELNTLRLIDVKDKCIVETTDILPYVALSYVWGSAINLRLTTFNKAVLSQPGALQPHSAYIPRTILDAVILVEKIKERYLWCDALCLIQNDKDDLKRGLKTMDLIYENAELTIIAAHGHDANAGLPGVREGTRLSPRFEAEIIPGVALSGYLPVDQRMKQSMYSSRAWTFQEELLSSRTLFFIDELVYFRCRSTTLFELFRPSLDRRITKIDGYNDIASMLPTAGDMFTRVLDFESLILYYTRRSLTNQEDVLNAVEGILQRLSRKMKWRFLVGLPTACFDYFIIFRRHGMALYRRPTFPSYSWAGWKGPLTHGRMPYDNVWLNTSTWIIWYRRSARGALNLVWDILANEDFPMDDDSYLGYRKRTPFQPPVPLAFPTSRTQPTENLDDAIPVRTYPVLQFWTLSAFFNIKVVNHLATYASIIDEFGTPCGALCLDNPELVVVKSAKPYELIAISAVHHRYWGPSRRPEYLGVGIGNNERGYNVMLLIWNDGLAERGGVGFIGQEDFINKSLHPGAQWKEIILG
ncbi:HET-domain-containing protein [Xylaria scruposa]|nr:HET-domain-containing protein [Xylaria scruposa]